MVRGLLKGQEGFTLIEVLVSVALIAIGVLGFSLNTVGVIQGNHISTNYTAGINLAQEKLEELEAQASLANTNNCPPNTPDAANQNITATGAAGGTYDRCWVVAGSMLGANLKQVDVTVSWEDYMARSVTLTTLVYTE